MTRLVTPAPDAVSDALQSLSVRSTILCVSELRAPWAFSVTGDEVPKFHIVLEGTATVLCPGARPIALRTGDVVVLPRGVHHTLAADDAQPARALDDILAGHDLDGGFRLRYGGDGPLTRLLCGGFSVSEAVPESALALLPDVVHAAHDPVGSTKALEPVLAAMTAEAESGRRGASAVLAKIADVFLASVLRSWFARDGAEPPGIVGDAAVANAVRALTSGIAEPWSLDRLARRVGLSRTALATRFRRATGHSPMGYLTVIRLNRAAAYLAAGGLSTYEIARMTGYQNDASLSKAFKRRYGVPPGAYRKSSRGLPAVETADVLRSGP